MLFFSQKCRSVAIGWYYLFIHVLCVCVGVCARLVWKALRGHPCLEHDKSVSFPSGRSVAVNPWPKKSPPNISRRDSARTWHGVRRPVADIFVRFPQTRALFSGTTGVFFGGRDSRTINKESYAPVTDLGGTARACAAGDVRRLMDGRGEVLCQKKSVESLCY